MNDDQTPDMPVEFLTVTVNDQTERFFSVGLNKSLYFIFSDF